MKFLVKIQNLPESTRKIILWSIIIILGLALLIFWLKITQKKLKSFPLEDFKKQIQLPQLEERLKNYPKIEIPKLEIPEISEEELKKELEESQKPY